MVLAFGEHRLDIERRELRHGAELIDLEPKVFDLLAFLVLHRDRVVSKDDLLQAVWDGRIVSEFGADHAAQCGAPGARRRWCGTKADPHLHPQGRALCRRGHGNAGTGGAGRSADQPSIAVLPFRNISGDPEQEYFVDGMVEEIITALSRIRWLFVIAGNSSFTYKGQAVEVKRVGRELGVRYVLEGSVRKGGNRVRITGQLIDAATGAHLWADHFDGSLEDVFDLQDRVASSVAGVIEPVLQAIETARSATRPTSDLTAYDLYLRAYAMFLSSARQFPAALRLMEQAIARDPHYGPALAWAAICCFRLILDSRSEDPAGDRLKGADFARRALEGAGDDPAVLANAAVALAFFGEDIGAMMALVDRALALNPNFARGWHTGGMLRVWAGQSDSAIEYLEAALRLSPCARIGTSANLIGAGASLCPALRPGRAKAAARDPGRSELSRPISLSGRLLRPSGPARRRTRDHRAAARHHRRRDPGREPFSHPRASRAASLGIAPDARRIG